MFNEDTGDDDHEFSLPVKSNLAEDDAWPGTGRSTGGCFGCANMGRRIDIHTVQSRLRLNTKHGNGDPRKEEFLPDDNVKCSETELVGRLYPCFVTRGLMGAGCGALRISVVAHSKN